jgi:phage terminase large subunit-like protein
VAAKTPSRKFRPTAKTAKEVGRKAGVRIKKAVDELVGKTMLDLQAAGLMDPDRKVSAAELMTVLKGGALEKFNPTPEKEAPKPKPPRVFSPPKGVIRGPLTLTHGGKRWRVADLLRCLPKYDPFDVRQAKRWYFDTAAAQKALDFFEKCLRFIEGADVAGKPFVLQRWQAAIVANLFGWKESKTGLRRYRRCLLYVPRKNGKTPLAAGILLYVAFLDKEPGAQIYTAASDKEQASLIYRHAAMMAQNEPILAKRCRAYRSHKTIEIPMTATFVRVLASDAHNKHGQNAHLVVIDELHAHQDDGELCRVLITSTASRTQPLVMYTTTADFLQESECNRVYDQFDRVRKGEAGESGDRFLPIMYEADLTDDWTKPEVWAKANPNLNVSVRPDYLEEQVDEAKRNHLLQNDFCRLHLNIRTEVAEKAFDMTHWASCWKPSPQYSNAVEWRNFWLAKLRGEKCHAGVDLSSTDDVTALVLFFPAHKVVLPFFWCPTAKLDARQKKSAFTRYRDWQRDGFIMPLDGD